VVVAPAISLHAVSGEQIITRELAAMSHYHTYCEDCEEIAAEWGADVEGLCFDGLILGRALASLDQQVSGDGIIKVSVISRTSDSLILIIVIHVLASLVESKPNDVNH
jgi:hypothetical protein